MDTELQKISKLLEEGLTLTEICLKIGKPFSQVIALVTQDPQLLALSDLLTASTIDANALKEIDYKYLEKLSRYKNIDALTYCILRALSKTIDILNNSKSLYHTAYALKELSSVYKMLNVTTKDRKSTTKTKSNYKSKVEALRSKIQGVG